MALHARCAHDSFFAKSTFTLTVSENRPMSSFVSSPKITWGGGSCTSSWSFWIIIQWCFFRWATNRLVNRFGLIQKSVCNFSGEAQQSYLLFLKLITDPHVCSTLANHLQISTQCTKTFKYQHLAFIGEWCNEISMSTRSTPPIVELYSFTMSGQDIWMYFFDVALQLSWILKQVEPTCSQTSAAAWFQNWHQF